MSNDLLFSVLPRRGTVPVKSDRGEVKKVDKKSPIHPSPEDENLPLIKEREEKHSQSDADKGAQSDSQTRDYSDEHVGLIVDTTDDEELDIEQTDSVHLEEYKADGKEEDDDDHKGNNLDVTV